jgi:hypothetical protein
MQPARLRDDAGAGRAVVTGVALDGRGEVMGDGVVGGCPGLEVLGLAADPLLDLAVDRGALMVGGDLDGHRGERRHGQRHEREDLDQESGPHRPRAEVHT